MVEDSRRCHLRNPPRNVRAPQRAYGATAVGASRAARHALLKPVHSLRRFNAVGSQMIVCPAFAGVRRYFGFPTVGVLTLHIGDCLPCSYNDLARLQCLLSHWVALACSAWQEGILVSRNRLNACVDLKFLGTRSFGLNSTEYCLEIQVIKFIIFMESIAPVSIRS
jgi:hypothetical protein